MSGRNSPELIQSPEPTQRQERLSPSEHSPERGPAKGGQLNKKALYDALDQCMVRDRFPVRRQIQRLKTGDQAAVDKLQERINRSTSRVQERLQAVPDIEYDEALPVVGRRDEIREAIEKHQVVVIAGETGSGKTTQIPKICLEAGRGIVGQIGHTQPRRLAARSVASRIAQELKVPVGEQVGYQVRFTDHGNENTLIKLMTDGILLAEIQNDRFLNRYDTLIIDEAHERSLNIDFLLGYLKILLPKRPDLKLIITSATIDVERFSRHFDNAPVIEVSGRTYPVEVNYRPMEDLELEGRDADLRVQQGILSCLREIEHLERSGKGGRLGGVLVFLSGEREIRETNKFLKDARLAHTEILPLYARLSAAEQNRIFQPHGGGRRVILSTNVAETSLTVPGIRYVIDPGTARISRYSVRSKVQRLPIEPISQASANQRKGRCGRVAEGVCYRLYSEEDFLGRPEFTDAEIVRTNLAAVILQMLRLGLGDIAAFPFVDAPDARAINDGFKLLQELGAVSDKRRMTRIGQQISRLPVDPRMARMLVEADKNRALGELLVITSALAIQDPRERPAEKKQAADQRHREHYHDDSDFMSLVQLWNTYEEQRQRLSQNQLRKYCNQQFLSFMRMREWRDLHRQLALACKEVGLKTNEDEASYADIHKSLLAGLLSHLGSKDDDADYMGARNRRFYVFPSSTLYKRKPKWLMTAELVETSRLFARTNAKVEPQWIEPLAGHLIKRNYFEPHWEKKRAQVVAFEQVTLYGLIIVGRRRVGYGAIDPVVSREIFIREALVEGHYHSQGKFQSHNLSLIQEVDELEAKSRRRDILVDPETLYQFYDEKLPANLHNGAGFEKWRKEAEKQDAQLLYLTKEYLMRHDADEVTENKYPDLFRWEGLELPLSYHFEPGAMDDGVTLTLPVQALRLLPKHRLEWLVPGMLYDKCVALVRALPKSVRKNFVPVPDYVRSAMESMSICDEPLTDILGHHLHRMSGMRILDEHWDTDNMPDHLQMNFRLMDENGKVLGQGRDLIKLKEKFGRESEDSMRRLTDSSLQQEGLKEWTCGELPEEITRKVGGLVLKTFPALVDQNSSVAVKLYEDKAMAEATHRMGVTRLFQFKLSSQLKFALSKMNHLKQVKLLTTGIMQAKALEEDLQAFLISQVFVRDPALLSGNNGPRDEAAFNALIEDRKGHLMPFAEEVDGLLFEVFQKVHNISKQLKGKISFDRAFSLSDIKQHLGQLIYPGFLCDAGIEWFRHYPRFLEGIEVRLEKLPGQLNKDRAWSEELATQFKAWEKRKAIHEKHKIVDENLMLYRWMLEEYRVSLFAQKLGTRFPVSDKRLRKLWLEVQEV
ncbi:ATP-dependent RNA helicase HrpA [Endozoicomonas sp. 8E]|uniref:ATP-dependent RNA helicase HrpA n=1 Tax=Endozoicomonas sp. 8E TaxID=3035692 RepID=UPI0029391F3F|nr:ATP-dependent RNA helicase HrpA [Endozoicomonas sp. 8E]WOG29652.1 ATP-dependent RNA helicase HrpA [Endozoicomonas sp. 8E]